MSQVPYFTGITIIQVPYWWDQQLSSLATTIYNQRPELFNSPPQGTPIPMNPPLANSTTKTSSGGIYVYLHCI